MQHHTNKPTNHKQLPAYLKGLGVIAAAETAGRTGEVKLLELVIRDLGERFPMRPDLVNVAARHVTRAYDRAFVAALRERISA